MISSQRRILAVSFAGLLLIIFFFTGTTEVLATDAEEQLPQQIQVLLNGKPINFDVPPVMEQNRVLVPCRAIGEAIGATVNWDEENQTVTLTLGGTGKTSMTKETGTQGLKEELTMAQKKLSTNLLPLVDEKYLSSGQSIEEIKNQLQAAKQFRPAGAVEDTINGKVPGDRAYVYIYFIPTANTYVVDDYAWEVTDRDEENHLAVAWVEVENLETLASLESVRQIRTVLPPVTLTNLVTTTKPATTIKLKVGDTEAFVNDKPVSLEVPVRIVNGRTMVPLRFISESLGAAVDWDEHNSAVLINAN